MIFPVRENVHFTQVYLVPGDDILLYEKIFVIVTLVFFCVATCCVAGCSFLDPVVGTWESSLGTATLDLSGNGEGMITVMGMSDSLTWENLGNGIYHIGGSRYTLTGDTLQGPIATYHKL